MRKLDRYMRWDPYQCCWISLPMLARLARITQDSVSLQSSHARWLSWRVLITYNNHVMSSFSTSFWLHHTYAPKQQSLTIRSVSWGAIGLLDATAYTLLRLIMRKTRSQVVLPRQMCLCYISYCQNSSTCTSNAFS